MELDEPFEVCKEGDVLGSGQTTLLKMFGVTMAEFGVEVRAWWIKETGQVEVVKGAVDGGSGIEENKVMEIEMAADDETFEGFDDQA